MKLIHAMAFLVLAALAAAPAAAQDDGGGDEMELTRDEALLRAILLPETVREARRAGVVEEELKKVLRTGRDRDIPPGEFDVVLQEEVRAVKEHGPIDNFGAFVQSKLDQGLRGRALAAAIRAEHAARGKGPGAHAGKGKARGGREAEMGPGAGKRDAAGEAREERSGKGKAKRKSAADEEDGR